jgi:hypothetical protein
MSKHGIWFDLYDHIKIHDDVLQQYQWLIARGQTEYLVENVTSRDGQEIEHSLNCVTTNGHQLQILKTTITSQEMVPLYGLTASFSYNCFKINGHYELRYHSAHSKIYNSMAPWHSSPHRHEFDGKVKNIEIYSKDFRPLNERKNNHTWKGHPVKLVFLEHENWPFISEFLEEVSHLK